MSKRLQVSHVRPRSSILCQVATTIAITMRDLRSGRLERQKVCINQFSRLADAARFIDIANIEGVPSLMSMRQYVRMRR